MSFPNEIRYNPPVLSLHRRINTDDLQTLFIYILKSKPKPWLYIFLLKMPSTDYGAPNWLNYPVQPKFENQSVGWEDFCGIKSSWRGHRGPMYLLPEPAFIPPDASNARINLHHALCLQYGSCHPWLVESPDEIVQNSTDQSGLPGGGDWFSFIFLVFSFSSCPAWLRGVRCFSLSDGCRSEG